MCADGPADDLDFYDLEFKWGLSVHNRLMYCRRKTNNLLRSWILFQEHIINNDVVRRHAVQNNGFEPWLLPNSAFRFRLPWNAYGLGAIPIEYGRILWLNFFPMWVKCTLNSPFFEV
jgi:hypothetical protein